MAKNRVRLNISGVNCTLLTEENEDYVREMAKEVETLLDSMTKAGSNFSVAAVITALSFLDESKKSNQKLLEVEDKLLGTENDLRYAVAEYKKLKTENDIITSKIKRLEAELKKAASRPSEAAPKAYTEVGELRNPFRPQLDETGLVSFYEKISFFDEN